MKSSFICMLVFFVAVAVAGCDSGGEAAALDVEKSDAEKYNAMMEESMAGYEKAEEAIKDGE